MAQWHSRLSSLKSKILALENKKKDLIKQYDSLPAEIQRIKTHIKSLKKVQILYDNTVATISKYDIDERKFSFFIGRKNKTWKSIDNNNGRLLVEIQYAPFTRQLIINNPEKARQFKKDFLSKKRKLYSTHDCSIQVEESEFEEKSVNKTGTTARAIANTIQVLSGEDPSFDTVKYDYMKKNEVKLIINMNPSYSEVIDYNKPKNEKKTFERYKKAAEQGDSDAQYKLGRLYYFGNGVKENLVEAVKWFRKAADQGDPDAQYAMGLCYYHGNGVEKNHKKAMQYFKKASEQNYKPAIDFISKYMKE